MAAKAAVLPSVEVIVVTAIEGDSAIYFVRIMAGSKSRSGLPNQCFVYLKKEHFAKACPLSEHIDRLNAGPRVRLEWLYRRLRRPLPRR